MKKRFFAILLAASLLATLTACGDTGTETNNEVEATENSESVVESTEAEITEAEEPKEEESVETTEIETVESEDTETVELDVSIENSEAVSESEESVVEESAAPAYTYTDLSVTMYAQQTVNVRTQPSTDGEKVGSLSTNQEVSVTGQCNETSWYRISYNGSEAYVSNKYLDDNKVEITQTTTSNNSSNGNSTSSNSCPYTLNTIFDDGGDYVYYYYIDTNGDSMHGAAKEAMYAKGYNDDNVIWSYEDMGNFAEGHVLKCIMKYGFWGQ